MVTTNRITWVSIPASACAVCTQWPRSAHTVQELPLGWVPGEYGLTYLPATKTGWYDPCSITVWHVPIFDLLSVQCGGRNAPKKRHRAISTAVGDTYPQHGTRTGVHHRRACYSAVLGSNQTNFISRDRLSVTTEDTETLYAQL